MSPGPTRLVRRSGDVSNQPPSGAMATPPTASTYSGDLSTTFETSLNDPRDRHARTNDGAGGEQPQSIDRARLSKWTPLTRRRPSEPRCANRTPTCSDHPKARPGSVASPTAHAPRYHRRPNTTGDSAPPFESAPPRESDPDVLHPTPMRGAACCVRFVVRTIPVLGFARPSNARRSAASRA